MTQKVDLVCSVDDFLSQYREAKSFVERIILWPRRWRKYQQSHGTAQFAWTKFALTDDQMENVPDEPGIYTISIEPEIASHPGASFLMYVGKTEQQTLRARFGQYLKEKYNPKGRGHIVALLNEYSGFLAFHCASVPSGLTEDDAEKALQAAFIPPYCKQLPAQVGRVRRAFS